LKKICDLIF